MSVPVSVACEVAVSANPQLTALDEESNTLSLANFHVAGATRYLVQWERGHTPHPQDALRFVASIAERSSLELRFAAAWASTAHQRIRNLHRSKRLARLGWRVHSDGDVNVALVSATALNLVSVYEQVAGDLVGWVVFLGGVEDPARLLHPPFRETIRHLCLTLRLAPSKEFIEGVVVDNLALAYGVGGDDQLPGLVIVTARELTLPDGI